CPVRQAADPSRAQRRGPAQGGTAPQRARHGPSGRPAAGHGDAAQHQCRGAGCERAGGAGAVAEENAHPYRAHARAGMNTKVLHGGWREGWHEAMAGAGRDWIFVAKACLAEFLTAWIAMRVGLEQPGTAMLTCAIVINPHSGMVLATSFYRGLGTLVGCLASMALLAAFPQQRDLLLAGLALWLGVCAGGASLFRNFKSYGFVLAGYTAGIVILPVLGHPDQTFQSALMRVSEVMLGILVAGVVSDVIAPQRLSQALRGTIRAQFTGFVAFVRDSMAGSL